MPKILLHRTMLLASTAISMGSAMPAWAQGTDDIIVTARRVEERLLDVPISISVLNQEQLNNNNVANMKDLAAYTPGLQINSRYGSDSTNFSIRGFTQEQRTYATVGTYFADVVAPRGSGATFGGDGAGPGALFDLQNVQVLKGPQGTLQGRNSTGGAVLLVPRKPTGKFEGYVEGSVGDYEMRRIQAVVNVPVMESLRLRFGVDRQTRDGYLKNIGRVGDGAFGNKGMGNVNYTALRASAVADITPTLENYTVFSYSYSKNNGVIPKMTRCFPGVTTQSAIGLLPFGDYCAAQMAREANYAPWTVSNRLPNSSSVNEQWQIINTLTWQASDSLTVKNIMSYGQYRGTTNIDLFGNYFLRVPAGTETSAGQITGFAFTSAEPFSGKTNSQASFVEELQFQGRPGDGRFIWQAGLYAEINDPLGYSGVQTATLAACADIANLNCTFGTPNFQRSKSKFRDYAVYGQASYSITDNLKLTAGLRYTWDKQISTLQISNLNIAGGTATCVNASAFPGTVANRTFPIAQRSQVCEQNLSKDSEAPTWLLGLDFKPTDDTLLYAKYSRGYRQGGLSLFSPDTTQSFNKEKVNTYEVGAKASWRGAVPGNFSISGYYNSFTDQQLLLGVTSSTNAAPPSASIVNAGKSRMYGFETELDIRPFQGFRLNLAYSYLNSKLQQFVTPALPAGSPYNIVTPPLVGDDIPNSQPHKATVGANYTLPLPETIGAITLGANYIYTGKYRSVADSIPHSGDGIIPTSHLLNLNINWTDIGGRPVDVSAFMTNVTNEVIYLTVNDNATRGFLSSLLAEPRMYGIRLKYRFGN